MFDTYRAMCAELTTALEYVYDGRRPKVVQELIASARTLLDQPEPEGLTDDDLRGIFYRLCDSSDDGTSWIESEEFIQAARAAIAADHSRRPTPQPEQEGLPMPSPGDAEGLAEVFWAQREPQPPVDGEVAEVLQWPAEWSRRQRAQEAEMLCCSAGMTPGKEMQQIVEDARDGMPLQHLHDLISHAIPTPQPLPDNYIDPGHTDRDRELLEIFYVACQSEGGTADEIHLRGIRAVMAQPPVAAGEVAELVEWLGNPIIVGGALAASDSASRWLTRTAELLQRQHPQPVPVSERPWEREGWCDEQGRCWLRRKHEEDGVTWRLMAPASVFDDAMQTYYAEALPANALPTP